MRRNCQGEKNKEPGLNLVNATEGGAIGGFDHMSLDAFASKRNLDEATGEKRFVLVATISNVTISDYLREITTLLDRIILLANQVIKLDKKSEKNRGLENPKNYYQISTLNDETSLVQIAMQDSIATVIGTSEKAQKVGTHAEFFEKVRHSALTLKKAANEKK